MPGDGWKSIFGYFRISRRALRLDKCNVTYLETALIIIRQKKVYHYDFKSSKLTHTLTLKNCRNVLHQSITVINNKEIFFGEYGSNKDRKSVPVYKSIDGGKSWQIIYTFPPQKIKHVHGCYYDPYEEKIWTATGDFKNECFLLCSDKNFQNIEWIGDGNQRFRTCNLFFEKDAVHWVMDSQLEKSYHIELNRNTRKISQKQAFPGPVWYIKKLKEKIYLATTANEIGPGVETNYAHIFISTDLEKWELLYKFKSDIFPKKYFKFGVIGFPDGENSKNSFYMFFEALKGVDGKIALCEIQQ
jgi:hypothetical protein